MRHSIIKSGFLAACVAGLVGCSEGTPLSPGEPEGPEAVFTASVIASVDGTITDANTRVVVGLADPDYAAQLSAKLAELSQLVAARDIVRAELAIASTRALIARTDVSQEVLDFAHDLSAVELILDQTEILLAQAARS